MMVSGYFSNIKLPAKIIKNLYIPINIILKITNTYGLYFRKEQNGTRFLPTPARVRQSPVLGNFTSHAYVRSYFWVEDEAHDSTAAFIRKGKKARPACIHSVLSPAML